jgi:hypothetical protein
MMAVMMAVMIITTAQLSSFLSSYNRVNLALGILVSMIIIHLMIIYNYDDSNDDDGADDDDDDDVYKRDDNYHYSLISYMDFHRLSISST